MKPIRVALVSDYKIYCDFERRPFLQPIEIVKRFHTLRELQEHGEIACDLLVIDTDWVDRATLEFVAGLRQQASGSRIMAISRQWDAAQIRALVAVGVNGILLRYDVASTLEYYIRTVHAGRFILSPALLSVFLSSDSPSDM